MMPLTSRAGVTSKPGLRAGVPFGANPHRHDLAIGRHAGDMRHFLGVALLDGNQAAFRQRGVEGRDGHRDIEGHAVILGRQRLQIGADLVADVAVGGDAVGCRR